MIVVPVTHDLVHSATVYTARLTLSFLDEVAEERGAWRKRRMVDVAVQGLVHSEHELGHNNFLPDSERRSYPTGMPSWISERGSGRNRCSIKRAKSEEY